MSLFKPAFSKKLAMFAAALALGLCAAAAHAAQDTPVQYDMRYSVSDDRLQVFDDGVNTRMMLPEGTQIPLVRTVKSGSEQLIPLQREAGTQFLLIPGLHHKLLLSWPGQRLTTVAYQGNTFQAQRAGANTSYGAAPVNQTYGSTAPPQAPTSPSTEAGVSGQRVAALPMAQSMNQNASGDLARGTAVTSTVAVSPDAGQVTKSPAQGAWDVRTADVNLENTFKRWAAKAGYQLLWDTERQVLIPAADAYSGSLQDAINRVLTSPAIRNSDHPLEAVIYANNPPLIRITRLGDQSAKE